jgi:hypothetical protein
LRGISIAQLNAIIVISAPRARQSILTRALSFHWLRRASPFLFSDAFAVVGVSVTANPPLKDL